MRGRILWWGKLLAAVTCVVAMWRLLPKGTAPLELLWDHPWYAFGAALLRPLFTVALSARTFSLARGLVPDLRLGTVVRATFIGQMANLILPSGAGGDLVRGTILARKSLQPWPRIVTLLVSDRLLGLLSLLACVLVFSLPLLLHVLSPAWLGWGAAFGVVSAGAVGAAWRLVRSRLRDSGFWRETVSVLGQMPRNRWIQAALLALLGHALLITSFSLVFSSVGVSIGWLDQIGIITLSLFLSSLPLTLGGHGIREGTLVLLLAAPVAWTRWPAFTSMDAALTIAAATWIIHVVANMTGGLIALSLPGGRSSPTKDP